jgi:ATP synthase protein I
VTGEKRPNHLGEPVRRRRARRDQGLREGEQPLGRNLALIGMLGWLVVVPTLLGLFIGRWIDRHEDTGIFWTAALLVVGVAVGCRQAWKRIKEE